MHSRAQRLSCSSVVPWRSWSRSDCGALANEGLKLTNCFGADGACAFSGRQEYAHGFAVIAIARCARCPRVNALRAARTASRSSDFAPSRRAGRAGRSISMTHSLRSHRRHTSCVTPDPAPDAPAAAAALGSLSVRIEYNHPIQTRSRTAGRIFADAYHRQHRQRDGGADLDVPDRHLHVGEHRNDCV